MNVIPAIDIIDGKCVRLTRGDFNSSRKYFDDPVEVAVNWGKMGAVWLHVIDLDGAKFGEPKNLKIAERIKEESGLKVEFGGGIRNPFNLEMVMNAGIDRAIIGTAALVDTGFLKEAMGKYGARVIISVDFDNKGMIYTKGWQQDSGVDIENYLPLLKQSGINEIIVTNITRDGTLSGPDTSLIKRVLEISGLNLIIAGGITVIEDIKCLKAMEKDGVSGVIIGKALYEGRIDLAEAIRLCRS